MDYFKIFKNINDTNNILIVSDAIKENIIKLKTTLEIENNTLFLFKIISESEFIDLISFKVTDEIYLNSLSKNFKQAITKELIKFSKYDLDNKLDELNDFKEMNSNFIIKNETFFNNKNNFKYYFIGDDTFIKPFIKYYNLNYENLNIKYNNTPKVLAFKSMEEEVFNLFIEISELLINGTNINEIYIANTDSSYFSYLRKFESLFKIPLSNILDINLYEIPFINDLMNYSLDDILYVLNNNLFIS